MGRIKTVMTTYQAHTRTGRVRDAYRNNPPRNREQGKGTGNRECLGSFIYLNSPSRANPNQEYDPMPCGRGE